MKKRHLYLTLLGLMIFLGSAESRAGCPLHEASASEKVSQAGADADIESAELAEFAD